MHPEPPHVEPGDRVAGDPAAGCADLAGRRTRPSVTDSPIVVAARRRHELTRSKAIRALRELERLAAPVTISEVATAAGISRSWIYTQPDIRQQIQDRRRPGHIRTPPRAPAGQQASQASLRARLEVALERNRQLSAANQQLRGDLAHALGQARTPCGCTRAGRRALSADQ